MRITSSPIFGSDSVTIEGHFDTTQPGLRIEVLELSDGTTQSISSIFFGIDDDDPNINPNDFLSGTLGADVLIGLGGNDTYTVNDPGDLIIEALAVHDKASATDTA